MRKPLTATIAAIATTTIFLSTSAHAQDAKECISQSEAGQDLRELGRLQSAKEAFVACAKPACPKMIRTSCTEWLEGLATKIPSMVIAVKDDEGHDVAAGKLTVDGKDIDGAFSGKAFSLDPGVHKFHFEAQGFIPLDLEVVAREGEQNRKIEAKFQTVGKTPGAGLDPKGSKAADNNVPSDSKSSGGPPTLTWVLGGVGIAAIGAGVFFGVSALSKKSDCDSRGSGPNPCSDGEKDSFKTSRTLTDVSLGIGIVAVGAAIAIWVFDKPAKPAETARITPTSDGFAVHF